MAPKKDIRIMVHQRGWVFVGEYSATAKEITLNNFSVIRRWGTTNGLPELAAKGPLANTVLDKSEYPLTCGKGTELFTIHCNPDNWK